MIVVAGEALIDLVVSPDGQVAARLGGGPCNAARALARLGAPTTFCGGLADDTFGRQLRARLTSDGVRIGVAAPSARPSTLAVAALDQAGRAAYRFYLDGTAAADLGYDTLGPALPPDLTAVHVGSLGLLMEPIGTAVERLVLTAVPRDVLVLLDPNCRPGAVTDHQAYRRRLTAVARRADITKASVEDLAYLYPGASPAQAAATLIDGGSSLVIVTDGPRPARAFLPGATLAANVPAVTVADTIGAGDAFGAAFLAWWLAHGHGAADLRPPAAGSAALPQRVAAALRVAVAAAARTCERPGADPPTRDELRPWWPAN